MHSICRETSGNVAKEPLDTPTAVGQILVNMATRWYPLVHELLAPKIIGALVSNKTSGSGHTGHG